MCAADDGGGRSDGGVFGGDVIVTSRTSKKRYSSVARRVRASFKSASSVTLDVRWGRVSFRRNHVETRLEAARVRAVRPIRTQSHLLSGPAKASETLFR